MTAAAPTVTCAVAEQTPAYGMRPVGGFGIRGWRVYCGHCDFLSRLYTNHRSCEDAVHRHRRRGSQPSEGGNQ